MSSSSEQDSGQDLPGSEEAGSLTVHAPPGGPLHFRAIENGQFVMIGQCCTIIDVQIDEKLMEKGGRLVREDEEGRIMTFTWENPSFEQNILTKICLNVIEVFDGFYKDLCDGFVENKFKLTRDFVEQLYQRYRVCMTGIVFKCIVFEIVHMNQQSVQKMESEREQVLKMCEEFLQKCTKRDVKVTLTFESATEIPRPYFAAQAGVLLRRRSRRHQDEVKHKHESSADSKKDRQRFTALAKLQATTRAKITNISETLKHISPRSEMETHGSPPNGSLVRKSIVDTKQKSFKNIKPGVMSSEPLLAVAAHVEDQRPVNPFGSPQDSSHKSGPSILSCEGLPTDDLTTDLKKALKIGITVTDADITTSDYGLSATMTTKALQVEKTQEATHELQYPSPADNRFLQESTEALPDVALSAETEKAGSNNGARDGNSSHETASSDGGAKPKVKGESPEAILEMVRSARGGKSDLGFKRISQSVEVALIDDVPAPPRAESLDTVLCLDCSDSMAEAFDRMKTIAETFVDDLDDIAGEYGLEENVAVISMSGRARVVQHLTNDYSKVRDAIDSLQPRGKSPIFETIMVSLAAIQGKGRSICVSGVRRIPPRIIFITDGKVTDENHDNGADFVSNSCKMTLLRLATDLGSRKQESKTHYPITWIPVGDAEKDFLTSLAKLGRGHLAQMHDVPKLARFYRIQDSIGKIYAHVQDNRDNYPNLQEHVETVTQALTSGSLPEDKDEIVDSVVEMLSTRTGKSADDFDNVYENPELAPLGTRVMRGPEWKWKDQDSEGFGTIINHEENENWVWVLWDKGELNRYRYNEQGAFDLLPVDSPHPILDPPDVVKIGVQVKKDPSFVRDKDNSERGRIGVVIRVKGQSQVKYTISSPPIKWGDANVRLKSPKILPKKVGRFYTRQTSVRWDNRTISTHTLERGKIKDLIICQPGHPMKDQRASKEKSEADLKFPREEKQPDIKGNTVWRWKDESGQWHLYPQQIQLKLKQEYQRRSEGSCLVKKGQASFRIFFKSMCEKALESSIRHEVERISVDENLPI